jgi:hypothetical protein
MPVEHAADRSGGRGVKRHRRGPEDGCCEESIDCAHCLPFCIGGDRPSQNMVAQ